MTGLTQSQFADLLGVSRPSIAVWENGYREPSGSAKTLLAVTERHPKLVTKIALSLGQNPAPPNGVADQSRGKERSFPRRLIGRRRKL